MEEGVPSKKRLVLTTVNDRQTNVQIDLYRGEENIDDASYVGSLLIENIPPADQGEAEVELVVGLDAEGTLSADAYEASSGERRSLSVRMDDSQEISAYDMPDFDLSYEPESGFEPDFDEETDFDEEADFDGDRKEPPAPREKSGVRKLLITLLVILSIAFIGLLIYCLMNCLPGEDPVPLQAGSQSESSAADPGLAAGEKQPRMEESGGAPPPQEVQLVEERVRVEVEGVWYRVRRGDTLWDISSSFYSSPWLYGTIAEENQIENPDLIFTEQKIFIPTQQ